MRQLVYVFTDGTETTNYAEALINPLSFKASIRDVITPPSATTPIREAYLKEHSYIKPDDLKVFADCYMA